MSRATHPESSQFFAMVPRRSAFVFFAAVFAIFSPVGLLLGSSFAQRRPLHTLILAAVISGCIAVSWAAAFTLSRWWIVGIVLFSALQMAFFSILRRTSFGIGELAASLEGFAIVAAITLGYALFVVFLTGQGRTTFRLQTEMALAQRIHQTLVPPLELTRPGFDVLGFSAASSEMGGDLIDAIDHGEATDIVLADVSGHGVSAGVVMGMVKSAIRTALIRPPSLADLLVGLSDVLEQTTAPEMYATLTILRIRADGRGAEYALAGHHPILHYHAAGKQVTHVEQRQRPLGLLPRSEFASGGITLASGDLLALYTDGLNETENAAGEQLGHEPIEHVLAAKAEGTLPEIQRALLELARGHGDQTDDRTILLVRVK